MGKVLVWLGLAWNPVFEREFRTRVRGLRSFLVQGGFCLILMAALGLFWWSQASMGYYRAAADFSRDTFYMMMCIQAVLVPLIAPAMSSGAISLERERETLDMLLLTPLSRATVITGKLGASLAQLCMVVLAGVPVLAGVCLVLGGVSPLEMLLCYAFILLSGASFGALGILCSCVFKRTAMAVTMAYIVSVFCVGGSALVDLLIDQISRHYSDPMGFMILSPPVTIVALMEPDMDTAITDLVGYAVGTNVEVWMLSVPIFLMTFLLCAIVAIRRLRVLQST